MSHTVGHPPQENLLSRTLKLRPTYFQILRALSFMLETWGRSPAFRLLTLAPYFFRVFLGTDKSKISFQAPTAEFRAKKRSW